MSVLGEIKPDPIAEILGTGFGRFHSSIGIKGLAQEKDDKLWLLAIDSITPGQGAFREFIIQAKKEYRTIIILQVWNLWLNDVLKRYGFVLAPYVHEDEGDHYLWKADP